MNFSETFQQLLEQSVETDRRLARTIGKHIDNQVQILSDVPFEPEPELLPLMEERRGPVAKDFAGFTNQQLKALLTAYQIKGRGRKGLKKADRIALLVEHGIEPLTYEFLLAEYMRNKCA